MHGSRKGRDVLGTAEIRAARDRRANRVIASNVLARDRLRRGILVVDHISWVGLFYLAHWPPSPSARRSPSLNIRSGLAFRPVWSLFPAANSRWAPTSNR